MDMNTMVIIKDMMMMVIMTPPSPLAPPDDSPDLNSSSSSSCHIYSHLKFTRFWNCSENQLRLWCCFPHNSHKCSDASCFVFQSSGLYPAVIGCWIGTKILIGSCYLILSLAATFYIIIIIIFIITSTKNPMTNLRSFSVKWLKISTTL